MFVHPSVFTYIKLASTERAFLKSYSADFYSDLVNKANLVHNVS